MGARHRRALIRADTPVLPRTLGPHPKREGSNLGSAWVDIDTVQIVFDDQCWQRTLQGVEIRVVLVQRVTSSSVWRRMRIVPGLLVDCQQEVEGIKQEVA
jgi:hypothetical protein